MARIYYDNSLSIGDTPLVKINRITKVAGADRSGQDRRPQPGRIR